MWPISLTIWMVKTWIVGPTNMAGPSCSPPHMVHTMCYLHWWEMDALTKKAEQCFTSKTRVFINGNGVIHGDMCGQKFCNLTFTCHQPLSAPVTRLFLPFLSVFFFFFFFKSRAYLVKSHLRIAVWKIS